MASCGYPVFRETSSGRPPQADSITAIGDAHLGKLEAACRNLLQQISVARKSKKDKDAPQSPTSAALPSYTEVALVYTEVLQLQVLTLPESRDACVIDVESSER